MSNAKRFAFIQFNEHGGVLQNSSIFETPEHAPTSIKAHIHPECRSYFLIGHESEIETDRPFVFHKSGDEHATVTDAGLENIMGRAL